MGNTWASTLSAAFRFVGKRLQVGLLDDVANLHLILPRNSHLLMATPFYIPISNELGLGFFHMLTSMHFPFLATRYSQEKSSFRITSEEDKGLQILLKPFLGLGI